MLTCAFHVHSGAVDAQHTVCPSYRGTDGRRLQQQLVQLTVPTSDKVRKEYTHIPLPTLETTNFAAILAFWLVAESASPGQRNRYEAL